MEMGQEAAASQESTAAAATASEQPQEATQPETVESGYTPATGATITVEPTATSSLAFAQQQQLISNLSNVVAASSEGGTPVSLASLLQDVVSGIQTSAGTVPAAIITDPSSSTGSFLIVNQNGVPIVRPVLVSSIADGSAGVGLPSTFQVLAQGGTEEGADGEAGHEVAMDVTTAAEAPVAQGKLLFADEVSRNLCKLKINRWNKVGLRLRCKQTLVQSVQPTDTLKLGF